MLLDPDLHEILGAVNGGQKITGLSVPAAREALRALTPLIELDDIPIGSVSDSQFEGPDGPVPIRIYTPLGIASSEPLPALVYFHGGGFVLGDLETHDGASRRLANESRCKIISVAYRLAPEHPFPAGVEDCIAAVQYVIDRAGDLGVDADRLAVGGDSAGGNIAATVAMEAKRRGWSQVRFQLLIYPYFELVGPKAGSREENAKGYFLEEADLEWFIEKYLPDSASASDRRATAKNEDDLVGLPSAYVVTAGFDPLRDEGNAYADRLSNAGVPVTLAHYPGMVHGFHLMGRIVRKAPEALAAAAAAVRANLYR